MAGLKSLRDALGRFAFRRIPGVRENWERRFVAVVNADTPWTGLTKPLSECRVALVTTAGVHHADQPPFDMANDDGDASFRVLDLDRISDYTITHDYYDHRDADRDLNVVLPVDRLREAAARGLIGALHTRSWSFMGHIQNQQRDELLGVSAPRAAAQIAADAVDVVLLTPA